MEEWKTDGIVISDYLFNKKIKNKNTSTRNRDDPWKMIDRHTCADSVAVYRLLDLIIIFENRLKIERRWFIRVIFTMRNLARRQETQVARKTVDILFIYDLAKVKKRRKSKQIFETKFDRCLLRLTIGRLPVQKQIRGFSKFRGRLLCICDKSESCSLRRVSLRICVYICRR